MSLRSDHELSDDALRYERARVRRRWFEIVTSVALVAVAGLVGALGAERVPSSYALVVFWLVFNEAVRRAMRQIGTAENVIESTELARVAPFVSLVQFLVAWIIAAELLIDAGVPAFGRRVTLTLSTTLIGIALAATWWGSAALHDRLALAVWLSLLVPTELASPRTARAAITVIRVVVALVLHMALMSRSEGRVSPSKWRHFDNTAIRQVMLVASNNSARKLAQTAWTVHAWPPLLLASLVIVALNEWGASRSPVVRQQTSPPPTPRQLSGDDDDDDESYAIFDEDAADATASSEIDLEASSPAVVGSPQPASELLVSPPSPVVTPPSQSGIGRLVAGGRRRPRRGVGPGFLQHLRELEEAKERRRAQQ